LTARHYAHRGLHDASKGIIENTQSAVSAAIAAGYGIEVDLRLAADGEAMVFHDATLSRLTREFGLLIERSSAELRKLPFKSTGDRMMTLRELTEQVAGRTPLLLEVKSEWGKVGPLERRVTQVLRAYRGPVAVMSFDPNSLLALSKFAPALPRGIVSGCFRDVEYWHELSRWRRFILRHLLHSYRTRPNFVAYDIAGLPNPAPLVARKFFGLPLLTWTVRTKGERARAEKYTDAMIFEGFLP
jgi:glycerophosphoryl diester phosphodiesterase